MYPIAWWFIGFGVSIILAAALVPLIMRPIRRHIVRCAERRNEPIPDVYLSPLDVSIHLFASAERIFFTILVTFDVSATAAAMIGWITIKMVTDWNRIRKHEDDTVGVRSMAFLGLLGNLLSMLFALIGGLLCRLGLS